MKTMVFISGIFILVATIGFLSLPIYESSISEKRDTIQKLNLDWEDLRLEIAQFSREYDKALDQKNHSELQILLNADQVEVDKTIESMLIRLRSTIILAYHTAEDKSVNQDFKNKIKALNTYEKLWPILKELLDKTKVRHDNLVTQRIDLEDTVANMESRKNKRTIVFIIINSVGLFIGILSNVIRKK